VRFVLGTREGEWLGRRENSGRGVLGRRDDPEVLVLGFAEDI